MPPSSANGETHGNHGYTETAPQDCLVGYKFCTRLMYKSNWNILSFHLLTPKHWLAWQVTIKNNKTEKWNLGWMLAGSVPCTLTHARTILLKATHRSHLCLYLRKLNPELQRNMERQRPRSNQGLSIYPSPGFSPAKNRHKHMTKFMQLKKGRILKIWEDH